MTAKKLEICQKESNIAILETNINNIMQKLNEIREDIKQLKNDFEDFTEKYQQEKIQIITEISKSATQNFASKWTEKILIFI